MTHTIEHVLVMDTDDLPGRGGYGVVGISPGVTPAERLFAAENFGISDYLHDPQNDRLFFSVLQVPGGRHALVRRFANGTRRNGTQSRLFVHTLFLDDATFAAVHGLPWLLDDVLTTDREPLLRDPAFPALQWEEDPAITAPPVQRFQGRMKQVERWLAQGGLAVSAADAVAAVIAGFQSGRRVILPQGRLFEQLTLLAWSMLPPRDRAQFGWTQHDAENVAVPFEIANAVQPPTVDLARGATAAARWIVEMNTASAGTWREFHDKARRCNLTARGEEIAGWQKWRNALLDVEEKIDTHDHEIQDRLTALAETAHPKQREPWVDGVEVLQILWGNVRRALAAGQPKEIVVDRWAGLLQRSGLDRVIFRLPPPAEWLDAAAREIGSDQLVRFFRFTHDEPETKPTRAALARWLLERRPRLATENLGPLTGSLMSDETGLIEPLLDWLLDDPQALAVLERAPHGRGYGNFVLLATVIALRRQHPQTAAYVRNALLPQLEASDETRSRVSEKIADALAMMLRDDAEAFIRLASALGDRTAARLTGFVVAWLEDERIRTLPLAREIVRRASGNRYPAVAGTASLARTLAEAGEAADVWLRVLLRAAKKADDSADPAAINAFVADVDRIRISTASIDPLIDHLNAAANAQSRVGRCVRALIVMTRPAWTPRLVGAVAGVLGGVGRAAEWDTVVAALAETYGRDAGPVLRRFWEHVDVSQVPNVSEATIDATRSIDRTELELLLRSWLTRLRRLPAGDRCERFVDALIEAAGGVSPAMRIPLAWRALTIGTAGDDTLNTLDHDLWTRDARSYESEMAEALQLRAGGTGALQRVQAWLALLASDRIAPSVKFVCEGVIGDAFAALTPEEWNVVVRMPRETLFARGTAALVLARQLGSSGAADAARVFETTCRTSRRGDAADCLLLGRLDRKPWRRLQRALGFGSSR
ncbi:MAG TPA: hypothetical protein VHL59_19060 [Thermoanaerobaculia bacterium]|nr:hypothetical protein [Thermoanaerobaculia bacterium]